MTIQLPASLLAVVTAVTLSVAAAGVSAQAAAPAKKAPAKAAKSSKKAPAKKVAPEPPPPPEADADQVAAAGKVYYGHYDCEFKLSVDIVASPKYPSYVDVKHEKAEYLMKPVLSSTGAIRLEDVKGETLMVQISSKSMLLNVKTGHRIVDECVSPAQRELIEQARAAKAAEAASAAAAAAAPASSAAPAGAASAASMTTIAVPASAPTK